MSDGPYLYYKELNPGTAVIDSVFFQSYNSCTLQIEDYICTLFPAAVNIYKVHEADVMSKKVHSLELLKYWQVFGKLRQVKRLSRQNEDKSDLLILVLDSGKIIAAEYDVISNDLREYPLFNLEENAMGLGADVTISYDGRSIHAGPGSEPILKVDDTNKVVAAVINGEYLFFAMINENRETELSASHSFANLGDASSSSFQRHFTTEKMLQHIQQHLGFVGPILDIAFVGGYHNPTVAVLHQQHYLPVGHAKRVLHTCVVSVFTIDLRNQIMALLWSKANLPHDCLQLLQVGSEAMATWVTCISQNAIILLNECSIHAFAMNSFASITVNPKMRMHGWSDSKVGLELDASYWVDYGEDSKRESSIIGFLRDGTVVLVRFLFVLYNIPDSLRFDCLIIGESSPASTISILPSSHLLFVGSRVGKSVLYEIGYRKNETSAYHDQLDDARKWLLRYSDGEKRRLHQIDNNVERGNIEGGQVKLETDERMKHILSDYSDDDDNVLEDFALAEEITSEEKELYGLTAIESDPSYYLPRAHDWIISLTVRDSLFNFGPILHGGFTKTEDSFSHLRNISWDRSNTTVNLKTNQTAASYITDRDCKDAMIISSGLNNDGHLHRVIQGVGFSKVGNRNFLGATRLFTQPLSENYSLVMISYENKTRILNCIIDLPYQHITLQNLPEIKFQEFGDESGLIVTSPTVFLGKINLNSQSSFRERGNDEGDIIAQVIPLGVRITQLTSSNIFGAENSPLQDMLLLEEIEIGGLGGKIGESILSADCCPGYLTLLTNFHRLFILKFNPDERLLELLLIKQVESISLSSPSLNWIRSEIVSVSLFFGVLNFDMGSHQTTAEKNDLESQLTPVEREEAFLYGMLVKDMNNNSISSPGKDKLKTMKKEEEKKDNNENAANIAPEAFAVIYEEEGFLTIVRLSDLTCVIRTNLFTLQETNVGNEVDGKHYDQRSDIPEKLQYRYVVESRLVELRYTVNETTALSCRKLCLFLLFHTGELVVYHAFQRNNQVFGWCKAMTQIIYNKRFSYGKLLRGQSDGVLFMRNNSAESTNTTQGHEFVSNYLETEDYLHHINQTLHKITAFNYSGQDAILISGNDPKIYFIEKGCSVMMPMGLPETPYVNYGQYLVLPLPSIIEYRKPHLNPTSPRCHSLIATLWYEFEDIDVFKNPGNIKHRAQRQSTFGLYRLLPNQRFSIYDKLSFQSLEVNQTVHKIFEIAKLTDHMTEQALLDKKTYLLYSSKDVYREYQPDVHSTLQENTEDVMYERYFPILESFSNPDPSIAPHPLVPHKEFRISLLQSGRIVDSFLLGENELVIDVTPLYLTVEKPGAQGGVGGATKLFERRVFILVSVLNKDARGEDSQGNGKLLLLGFDYAMFEEDVEQESPNVDELENRLLNDNIIPDISFEVDAKSAMDLVEEDRNLNGHKNGKKNSSSTNKTQSDFLGAIQPKLKLLWTGPGPASVVYQMPSFPSNVSNNMNNNYNSNPSAWNTSTDSMNTTQMFSNYVIATVGTTLYIYKLNSNTMELDQITFYFSQVRLDFINLFSALLIHY